MRAYCLTDTGMVRDHNEDAVTVVKNEDAVLLAIADGMGGHQAGEVASAIAINYLNKHFKETFIGLGKVDAVKWIKNAYEEINYSIFEYEKTHPEAKGMGTTLVLSVRTDNYVLFGNVGDSSGFVMKDDMLHKVTYDHTLVNLLVSAGELTKEEAAMHPKKNVLMKALGASPKVEVDIFDCDTSIRGILLASDGLTNMLDNNQITKTLLEENDEDVVRKLIMKANNRGGNDNISVAYLMIEGEE